MGNPQNPARQQPKPPPHTHAAVHYTTIVHTYGLIERNQQKWHDQRRDPPPPQQCDPWCWRGALRRMRKKGKKKK